MRWLGFLGLLILVLVAQSVIAPRAEIMTIRCDGLLMSAVFLGLHAAVDRALLQAWLLGLAADFMTLESPGVQSMAYLLVAAAVASFRDVLFVRSALTQGVVTFIAGVAVQSSFLTYARLVHAAGGRLAGDVAIHVFSAAAYSAVLSVIFHRFMLSVPKLWKVTG